MAQAKNPLKTLYETWNQKKGIDCSDVVDGFGRYITEVRAKQNKLVLAEAQTKTKAREEGSPATIEAHKKAVLELDKFQYTFREMEYQLDDPSSFDSLKKKFLEGTPEKRQKLIDDRLEILDDAEPEENNHFYYYKLTILIEELRMLKNLLR